MQEIFNTVERIMWPVLLCALTLFFLVAFQTKSILTDRGMLSTVREGQQQALEQGQRVQAQLDALAIGTQRLAEGGNRNAKAIVDRLKEMNITINPAPANTAAAQPAAEPAQK